MNHNVKNFTGRCLCGSITFSFAEKPLTCGHCHCESCRKWQCSAFATWASFQKQSFKLSGKPKSFESSKGNYRQFCGSCGSPLFMECSEDPDIVYVTLGSLEQNPDLRPTRHVSFEERVQWDPTGDSLPKYEGKNTLLT